MAGKKQIGAKDKPNDVNALIKRVNSVDATPEDREAFRKIINEKPELWRLTADMLDQARNRLIEETKGTGAMKELMALGCEQLKRELTIDSDGPLEKMLIDVAVFAWLRLSLIEQQYTGMYGSREGISLAQGVFWEKRLSAAHKRFEAACVNLARVRKLLRPKIKNQLNVAVLNTPACNPLAYGDSFTGLIQLSARYEFPKPLPSLSRHSRPTKQA